MTLFDKITNPAVIAAAAAVVTGKPVSFDRCFDFFDVVDFSSLPSISKPSAHLFDVTKFLQNISRKERLILCAYFHFFHSFELKRNAHFDALFRMLVDILHVTFRAIGKGHHRSIKSSQLEITVHQQFPTGFFNTFAFQRG